MKNKVLLYITFLGAMAFNGYSQSAAVKKADKQYEKYAYIDATQTYERVAAKGYKSADMFQKLGNAYYFNSELEKANKWYGELFAMGAPSEPEYYYRYAQTLKSVGDYKKADQMMLEFNQKASADLRGQIFKDKQNYMDIIKANSGRYNIEDAGINSPYSDYGSSFLGNKLVFTSSRDTGSFAQKKHKWTNQYFTNMYSADISPEGALSAPVKFA